VRHDHRDGGRSDGGKPAGCGPERFRAVRDRTTLPPRGRGAGSSC
jgi:hypothetical protein